MIRRMIPLLRVQWLTAWRGLLSRSRGGRSRIPLGPLMVPLLVLAFTPMVGLVTTVCWSFFLAADRLGQGELLITMVTGAAQILCLMFGVFYVISAFYFSKDLKLLVPLPVRPGEIILAKFLGILAGEYLTIAPLVIPGFLLYGLMAEVAWTYVPFAAIIFLLLPVLPLVISSLFALTLMRLASFTRNRDFWRVVGALTGVALAVVFQAMGRLAGESGPFMVGADQVEQVQRLLEERGALVEAVGSYLPTSLWATDALRAGAPALGVGGFLLFVGAALASLIVLLWTAEKLFLGGLEGGSAGGRSRRMRAGELVRQAGAVRSPLVALLLREIRLLNRTPAFLMTAILPVVLVPLFSLLPVIQDPRLRELIATGRETAAGHPALAAAAVGLVGLLTGFSSLGATAISREGRYFWISRSLPVPAHLQIRAKVIHSLLVSLLNLLVVLGLLLFFGLLRLTTLFYVVAGGLLLSAAATYIALVPDLLRPNLDWTDPQQAMKGNFNVLGSMIAVFLLMGLLAAAAVFLYFVSKVLMLSGLLIICGVLAAVLDRVVGQLADRLYLEYE